MRPEAWPLLLLLPVWLLLYGAHYWRLWTDDAYLQHHVANHHKSWLLRRLVGEERAAVITRKVMVPLGVSMLVVGTVVALGWAFTAE